MRKLGPVAGGAATLLDALLECLGLHGTLLMPLGAEDAEPFDHLLSPAEKEIGMAEIIFRRYGLISSMLVMLVLALSGMVLPNFSPPKPLLILRSNG